MFSRVPLRLCGSVKSARSSRPSTWHVSYLVCRFASSPSHRDEETVALPVGGNGHVDLKIFRPIQPSNHNNVLVHLPPGPLRANEGSTSNRSFLDTEYLKDAFPSTTIVDLQYRLTPFPPVQGARSDRPDQNDLDELERDHRFPTPIHDVFTAWDYITESLELHNHEVIDGQKIFYEPKICLYGTHIGGALAVALALTNPSLITAVAVQDVIADWTGIDEMAAGDGQEKIVEDPEGERKKRRESRKNAEREALRNAARKLMRTRGKLFRTHSGYFDSFASPILFLRAPGRDTPLEKTIAGEDIEGMLMRYGEEEAEVGIVPVTDETVRGKDFGPYDDDWAAHTSEGEQIAADHTKVTSHSLGLSIADALKAPSTPSPSRRTVNEEQSDSSEHATNTSSGTQPRSQASPSSMESPPRRRKVLRRWPPVSQPEDVLLPHIHVFVNSSPPKSDMQPDVVDLSPILRHQGLELQDLLQRACFWGREKGFAKERILLTDLALTQGDAEEAPENDGQERGKVVEWLTRRFEAV